MPAAQLISNDTVYLDIQRNARIIIAYTMAAEGKIFSSSMSTIEFKPHGKGTQLIYTEQGAYLGEVNQAVGREHGCKDLLRVAGEGTRTRHRGGVTEVAMSLTLYFHPLASFCHKALIALYENDTPFTPHIVDLMDRKPMPRSRRSGRLESFRFCTTARADARFRNPAS